MELSQLKYFREAARNEHITKAAEKLNVAQPAVTLSIHKLEEELGVKLFKRSGRGVELTECGKYLYEKATSILEELDAIPTDIAEIAKLESNTVKINVLAASTLMTDIIIAYKQGNEDVKIKISQDPGQKDCDITVTTNDSLPTYKAGSSVSFGEKIFIAMPKSSPYTQKAFVSLSELSEQGFISLAGSKQFRALCDRFCHRAGFSPKIIFESDNPYAVKNIIAAGIGIGFWPEYSWGNITSDDVKLMPIEEPFCSRFITVSKTSEKSTKAIDGFFKFAENYLSNLQKQSRHR